MLSDLNFTYYTEGIEGDVIEFNCSNSASPSCSLCFSTVPAEGRENWQKYYKKTKAKDKEFNRHNFIWMTFIF